MTLEIFTHQGGRYDSGSCQVCADVGFQGRGGGRQLGQEPDQGKETVRTEHQGQCSDSKIQVYQSSRPLEACFMFVLSQSGEQVCGLSFKKVECIINPP